MTHKQKLEADIRKVLKKFKVKGTRIVLHFDICLDLDLKCSGRVPVMAYACALTPMHEGRCWSWQKNVEFEPEVKP